jgi:hypothetical protein
VALSLTGETPMSAQPVIASRPSTVRACGREVSLIYPSHGCRHASAAPIALVDHRPIYSVRVSSMGTWLPQERHRLEVAVETYLASNGTWSLWDRRDTPQASPLEALIATCDGTLEITRHEHQRCAYWCLTPSTRTLAVTLLLCDKALARQLWERLHLRERYTGRPPFELDLH